MESAHRFQRQSGAQMIKQLSLRLITLSLFTCLTIFSHVVWSGGTATTFRVSKDFRSLIIQGERPEIVACMTATSRYVKKSLDYKELRWLDSTSLSAVFNENENNGQLIRVISLQALALLNTSNVFDSWTPIVIRCKQVDEGYPEVNLNVLGSSK
jgi:hypothetical protein